MEMIFRLTRFEMQYPEWVKRNAQAVINKHVVDPIRDKMEEKGYSKKIVERIRAEFVKIDTDGYITFDIISDYETDTGFDVAKMMEDGRVRYFVTMTKKKALSWITQGIRFFSLGHWIPERPGDEIVKTVMEEMESLAQQKLNEMTDEFLNYNLET
jgi:hypothetical protein